MISMSFPRTEKPQHVLLLRISASIVYSVASLMVEQFRRRSLKELKRLSGIEENVGSGLCGISHC